jgi:hypothetical protein
MNPSLETLAKLLKVAPGGLIRTANRRHLRLSPSGHVLVPVAPLLNDVFENVAPEHLDLRALRSQMTGRSNSDPAKRIDGHYYRHYGALKAALHETLADAAPAVKAALAAYPWDVKERELFEAAREAMRDEAALWDGEAEELAAKVERLRARKRAFDDAFASTPESGPLTERPAKVPRGDDDDADRAEDAFSSSASALSSSSSVSSDAFEPDSDEEASASSSEVLEFSAEELDSSGSGSSDHSL